MNESVTGAIKNMIYTLHIFEVANMHWIPSQCFDLRCIPVFEL